MSDQGKDFATLLYKLLIVEEVKSVKQVAAALGMKEQSLYSRLYGRVRFSVEETRDILRIIEDVRVADFMLSGSPFVAVSRSENAESDAEGVRNQASSTLFDVTDLMREVEVSLSDDGRIDHREKIKIEERLQEAERSLTALRKTIKDL
ncbi:MAG: phage regulatory CII family protein [Alphaproteobacteria bacterium]